MKIAIVVPHAYMWNKIMENEIFAPGQLAIDLSHELIHLGHSVTLFTAGEVETTADVESVSLKSIQNALNRYSRSLPSVIIHSPDKFHSLLKLIETEILISAFTKSAQYDLVHVFMTPGLLAAQLAKISKKPVICTIHDPYKMHIPTSDLKTMFQNIYFTALSKSHADKVPFLKIKKVVYNGIDFRRFKLNTHPKNYLAYFGRIIQPKGVHLAIKAAQIAKIPLKIAGKHFEGHGGDDYWSRKIEPHIDGKSIEYVGMLKTWKEKSDFLGKANVLLFPSTWSEPFGMAMIEANACGTPAIGFNRGSVPEVISEGINGYVVESTEAMAKKIQDAMKLDRKKTRAYVLRRFALEYMADGYEKLYSKIIKETTNGSYTKRFKTNC